MLGWTAAALTALGLYLAGRKNIRCWPVWLASNAFWITHFFLVWKTGGTLELSSIAINALFVGMNVKGWRDWRRPEHSGEDVSLEGGAGKTCSRIATAQPGGYIEWHSSACRRGISECTLHIMEA